PAEHQGETRETRARVDEVDNRVDYVEAQVAALAQQQAGKKWWVSYGAGATVADVIRQLRKLGMAKSGQEGAPVQ
ncbi:unnamed protein product, partial [Ectocarpus fasciculatus]